MDGDLLAVAFAPGLGDGDFAAPREIVGGDAVLVGEDFLEGALRDDVAAVDAGARAHVDDIVGGADRVLVMLDDEHGVAEVAEAGGAS